MPRQVRIAIALFLFALTAGGLLAAEKLPPSASWLPPGAVVTVEVTSAEPIFDLLLGEKTAAAINAIPEYQQLVNKTEFRQFRAVVAYLEATLGADWKTALRKLVSRVSLAAYPQGGALLIVEAQDEEMLRKLHDTVVQFSKAEAEKAGQAQRVTSSQYQGVTAWTLGNEEAHALVGSRLVVANRPAVLKAALDLRSSGKNQSLASSSAYQAARKAVRADAPGFVWLDMAMLKQHPAMQDGLGTKTNPLAKLLFAGLAESLQESSWLALSLDVKDQTLSLQAATDGQPGESSSFAFPLKAREGALANLTVPRTIASFSLYRDLHSFYAQKDKLFPDRTSGLIFFENMMGIFFTGRDLTDEVLAETRPETRLVVAAQQYDPKFGTPRVQIPAFAVVFRLQHPEKSRDMAEEAWQKALGLINFTRGQKAQPGLILDRPMHGKTQFTVARFPTPTEKEKEEADMRFNFRPALAMPGDYLVISSTEQLARDLIDALQEESSQSPKPLAGVSTLGEVDGGQLAAILSVNRANLVQQNMVEKGQTQEQAEREAGQLLTLVKLLDKATLKLGTREGRTAATLEIKLNLK